MLDGAVAGDVHRRAAVAQGAQLVRGGEGRSGVVGLVAQRAIELGGVPDRLVDGQPEVGGVDDQVVAPRLDAGCRELLGEQVGHLGELEVPVPGACGRVAGAVLPATADRRRDAGHRVEPLRAGAHRLEAGLQPDPLLGGPGAGEVGVVLVLLHLQQEGRGVLDGRAPQQPPRPVDQDRGLLRDRDVERIDLVGRHPGHVVVDRLRCQPHRLGGHRGRHPCHLDRPVGDRDGLGVGQHHAGGEPPGAAVDHSHGEAEVLGVPGALEHAVADAEVLRADPLEAEVGMARTVLLGAGQRDLAEPAVGERLEGGVRAAAAHAQEPSRRGAARAGRCRAGCAGRRGPRRSPPPNRPPGDRPVALVHASQEQRAERGRPATMDAA